MCICVCSYSTSSAVVVSVRLSTAISCPMIEPIIAIRILVESVIGELGGGGRGWLVGRLLT